MEKWQQQGPLDYQKMAELTNCYYGRDDDNKLIEYTVFKEFPNKWAGQLECNKEAGTTLPKGFVRYVVCNNFICEGLFNDHHKFKFGRKIAKDGRWHIGHFLNTMTPDGYGVGNLFTGSDGGVQSGLYDQKGKKGYHFKEDAKISKRKVITEDMILLKKQN